MSRAFLLSCLAAASALASAQAPKWAVYKGDGFSVVLPSAPKPAEQSMTFEGISAKTRLLVAQTPALVCVASSSVFSKDLPPNVQKNVIAGIKTGFVNSVRGTAGADRPATFGGHAGRLVDFHTSMGMVGQLWIVQGAGRRVFTLAILGTKAAPGSAAGRFFGSFRTP